MRVRVRVKLVELSDGGLKLRHVKCHIEAVM